MSRPSVSSEDVKHAQEFSSKLLLVARRSFTCCGIPMAGRYINSRRFLHSVTLDLH